MVGGFYMVSAIAGTSPPMTAFPLSMQAGGSSGTVGLTNAVLEVEGISEVEATYLSPVLSVGLFWTDSMWVSNFPSRSVILISIVILSFFSSFSSCRGDWRVSLSFKNLTLRTLYASFSSSPSSSLLSE
jgi:hypothetical protein